VVVDGSYARDRFGPAGAPVLDPTVMRGKVQVGIVSRSNLLRAFASMAREIPDPTADA
jgi:hypothetical protein